MQDLKGDSIIASERGAKTVARAALAVLVACNAFGADAADVARAVRHVVEETNAFRKAQGLDSVTTSKPLEDAAQEFARFMARTGKYGHGADGRRPVERATEQGYEYCIVAENIAYLYRSTGYDAATLAGEMVEGWKNSPEHRKNMAEPAVTQIGVGIAQGEAGRYYGVQMFGRPKSAAIRFSVRNRSGQKIGYRAGERSFSLPPRAVRTHTACRPMKLAIDLPETTFTDRPGDSASYVVVAQPGGGLAVKAD